VGPPPAPPWFNSLSWTNPGKVAFPWWMPSSRQTGRFPYITVRLLDLARPETGLRAASTDLPGVGGNASTAVSAQGVQVKFQSGLSPYRGIAAWPSDQRWVGLEKRSTRGTWQGIDRANSTGRRNTS
jgi:hypothetical protein